MKNKVTNWMNKHKVLATMLVLVPTFFIIVCIIFRNAVKKEEPRNETIANVEIPQLKKNENFSVKNNGSIFPRIDQGIKRGVKKAKNEIDEEIIEPTKDAKDLLAQEKKQALPVLTLYCSSTEEQKKRNEALAFEESIPQGMTVTCQLVSTLKSSSMLTPIIGVVTENVYWDGHLIIPSGVKVIGQTKANYEGDRIHAEGEWLFIWYTNDHNNGKTLRINGQILHRERDLVANKWGRDDMSAGIKGEIIDTTTEEEIKMFLAKFVGAVSDGLRSTERFQTPYGISELSAATLKNASCNGISSVLDSYAQRELEIMRSKNQYIQVPAGTQFYIFVTEPIDPNSIKKGNVMKWKHLEEGRKG